MKVELHCHSSHSDGLASVEEIMRRCADLQIGALAITDHNTFSGYNAAKRIAAKINPKLLLIPAVEITCRYGRDSGHVVALGVGGDMRIVVNEDVTKTIERIQKTGGIAIDVHPFGGFMRNGFTDERIAKRFDAIEVLNGNTLSWQNDKALELAERLGMPKTAGSDAHTLEALGKMACEIEADSVDEILSAIKRDSVKLPEQNTTFGSVIGTRIRRKAKNYLSGKFWR